MKTLGQINADIIVHKMSITSITNELNDIKYSVYNDSADKIKLYNLINTLDGHMSMVKILKSYRSILLEINKLRDTIKNLDLITQHTIMVDFEYLSTIKQTRTSINNMIDTLIQKIYMLDNDYNNIKI